MVHGNTDIPVPHYLQHTFQQLAAGKALLWFWKIKTSQTVHETCVTTRKKKGKPTSQCPVTFTRHITTDLPHNIHFA
jgi:hypothetical protein